MVEGFIYSEEILLRVGFREKSGISQMNFEASLEYSIKKKNIMTQIYLALDALGSMIDQYFKAEGDIELPIVWNEFRIDGCDVHLMTSRENSDLEAAADQFLKKKET